MNIVLGVLIVLVSLNLILTIVIGAFLVQFRQSVNRLFGDFVDVLEDLFGTIPAAPVHIEDRAKTWDEKYEEELAIAAMRLKENSGLKDLSMDQELSWGTPPALNPKNAEGLTIEEGTSNM